MEPIKSDSSSIHSQKKQILSNLHQTNQEQSNINNNPSLIDPNHQSQSKPSSQSKSPSQNQNQIDNNFITSPKLESTPIQSNITKNNNLNLPSSSIKSSNQPSTSNYHKNQSSQSNHYSDLNLIPQSNQNQRSRSKTSSTKASINKPNLSQPQSQSPSQSNPHHSVILNSKSNNKNQKSISILTDHLDNSIPINSSRKTSNFHHSDQQSNPPISSISTNNSNFQNPDFDAIQDDEVEPIDLGQELIKRRFQERQRLKRQAERHQRKLDEQSIIRSRSTHSTTRPTPSRIKTAPSPSSLLHQPPISPNDLQIPSTSKESLNSNDLIQAFNLDENSFDDHLSNSTNLPKPSPTSLIIDNNKPNSNVQSNSQSPNRAQSTYQSFGSPSQFISTSSQSSVNQPPIPKLKPKSSSSSHLSQHCLPSEIISSDPDVGDINNYQHQDQDQNQSQTPTVRGKSALVKAQLVRSTSATSHSTHKPSSQYSFNPSRHDDRIETQSLKNQVDNQPPKVLQDLKDVTLDPNPGSSEVEDNKDDNLDIQTHQSDDDNLDQDLDQSQAMSSASDHNDDDMEYTLKDRQDAINIEHPFGLPIWKPALYKKSRSVARNAEAALHNSPTSTSISTLTFGNLLWSIFFGIWLASVFAIVSTVLFVIPWGGSKYGRVLWELAGYLVWPFGKYVEEWSEDDEEDGSSSEQVHHDRQNSQLSDQLNHHHHPTGHPSRWMAVSEIDDDFNESLDGMTIRPVPNESDEHSPLGQPARTNSRSSNYGAISSQPLPINQSKDRQSSSSTIKHELGTFFAFLKLKGLGISKRSIRVRALGRLSFWATYYLIIAPLMLLACLLCWFSVFPIPMAKLLWVLVRHLGTEPLALHFRSPPTYIDLNKVKSHLSQDENSESGPSNTIPETALQRPTGFGGRLEPRLKPGQPAPKHSKKSLSASQAKGRLVSGKAKVLLCTYEALGLQYYKYTIDGVNIIFINLIPFVIFVIIDAFFLVPLKLTGFFGLLSSQGLIFVMALLSVVPLSYFIGMAVASISAQSSIGMGAVINATFGSIIEILLYGIALTEGKGELVEGSIIGSLLAGVLLMPGLSMIGGSLRRKEQRFNARSAGVTSTMLIMAIIGTLTPTLFYQIYGTFELSCSGCPDGVIGKDGKVLQADLSWKCKSCKYEHLSPINDGFYQSSVKSLSYYCAALLVLSYLIGLWFSLRTHASQIWQTPAGVPHGVDHGGHHVGSTAMNGLAHLGSATGLPHPNAGEHDVNGLTNQQRLSTYVRKLPEIVKQQLLSHLHRPPSSVSHRLGRQVSISTLINRLNDGSASQAINQSPGSHQVNRDQANVGIGLPRTLTTEEVNHTLHVLQMASAAEFAHPHDRLPGQSKPSANLDNLRHRDPSRSVSSHRHQVINMPPSNPHNHTSHISGPPIVDEEPGGGHDAPNWSRTKSTTVLLSCTFLYAIIAEILISVVDVVLNGSGIPEKFLGVTLFALVPNTTEFMNAISFAINGNIALSMEIGSAYALQVCLIQIPAMIAISSIYNKGKVLSASHAFTLVFPRWDIISIIFSVFLLTYTYIEARSNYHRGTILVLSYLVLIGGFYWAPN
ncbi:hypothetical protein O181_021575 [Austropuccinia psidii MF-1]|uniref:Uncharacterized protein n=1 Tax=Austropuccinia psidii MF-1 TaxID=1389203 RepID=A0A9Q3CFY5_9BASI|nr:hypothetical protein [Austropuccinia psidii MF-1]